MKEVEKPPKKLGKEGLSYFKVQSGMLLANIMANNGEGAKSLETVQTALEKWSDDALTAKVDEATLQTWTQPLVQMALACGIVDGYYTAG